MYYIAIVAFETGVIDNQGNPKIKKFKYIVEAESLFEVNKRLATYLSEDTRDSEVVSIAFRAGRFSESLTVYPLRLDCLALASSNATYHIFVIIVIYWNNNPSVHHLVGIVADSHIKFV